MKGEAGSAVVVDGASWLPGMVGDSSESLPYEYEPPQLNPLVSVVIEALRMQDV